MLDSVTMKSIIKVMPIIFASISSFFLIKGYISISIKDIIEISAPTCGINLDVAYHFCKNKSDVITGFVLLLLSLISQFMDFYIPLTWNDIDNPNHYGVLYSIALAIIIFLFSLIFNKTYEKKLKREIDLINKLLAEKIKKD